MISIIVPVFNVEKYLARCIESIIKQTFKDWELILINDGSKDNSGKICDEYATKDNRIKVIHKKNEGVSKARNTGIALAKGEYICFIDSDDWIEATYLSNFETNRCHYDFYFSGIFYDTYDIVYSYKKYKERVCRNKYEIRDEFFKQDLLSNGYPWGKLYKSNVIKDNNLRFNENLTINEDHIFVFQYFCCVDTLYITNTAGYHYTVFDNSGRKLSGKINSYTELKSAAEHFELIINKLYPLWNISHNEYSQLINNFVISKRLSALRSLILLNEKRFFSKELEYWGKTTYSGNNKKEEFLLFIIKARLNKKIKFLFIRCLLKIQKLIKKKDINQIIYNDLSNRSIIIKKQL